MPPHVFQGQKQHKEPEPQYSGTGPFWRNPWMHQQYLLYAHSGDQNMASLPNWPPPGYALPQFAQSQRGLYIEPHSAASQRHSVHGEPSMYQHRGHHGPEDVFMENVDQKDQGHNLQNQPSRLPRDQYQDSKRVSEDNVQTPDPVSPKAIKLEQKKRKDSCKDETDVPISTIKATGFKRSTSRETLELYFENRRRSSGGEITNCYIKVDNTFIATFEDPEDAQRVLSQQLHIVEDATLNVTAAVIPSIDERMFVLEGLSDTTSREDLTLYLEVCTGIDETPEFLFGTKQGSVLVKYSERLTDFDRIAKRVDQRKLKGVQLTAVQTEATNSILVNGIPPDTTEETIGLYFESKRRSGGDEVDNVQYDDDTTFAVVTFKDHRVVESVLKRKPHTVMNKVIEVLPYYECIGHVISTEEQLLSIPDPVSIDVDPQISAFIQNKQQHVQEMKKQISQIHGELVFVADDASDKIMVKPTFTRKTPKAHELVKTWSVDVKSFVGYCLAQFKCVSIPVSRDIWEQVKGQVQDMSMGDLSPDLNDQSLMITFVGKDDDVDNLKTAIEITIDDVARELEEQRLMVKETYQLDELKVKQLILFGFSDSVANTYPDVKIIIDEILNAVHYEGKRNDVIAAKCLMHETLNQRFSTMKVKPPKSIQDFLRNQEVSQNISIYFKENNVDAVFCIDGGSILCSARGKDDVQRALHVIQSCVAEFTIPLQSDHITLLPEWQELLADFIEEHHALVDISKGETMAVKITTSQSSVGMMRKRLEDFILLHTDVEESVKLEAGKLKFINEYKADELQTLQRGKLKCVDMTLKLKGHLSYILVTGTSTDVKVTVPKLRSMIDGILVHQYTIDKPGVAWLFTQEKGDSYLKAQAVNLNCVIDVCDATASPRVDEPEVTFAGFHTPSSSSDHGTMDISRGSDHGPTRIAGRTRASTTHFKTEEGINLNLVKGNIAMQKADVVVNTINKSCDLSVGVISQTIVKQAGQQLEDDFNKRKPHSVAEGDLITTCGGMMNCRDVYHICILDTHWNRDGTTEPLYRTVLQKCLDACHRAKRTSIAIPAIGTGGLGYPKDVSARIMYEEVKRFSSKNPNTGLSEVRVVVYDKDDQTCKAFEAEMIKLYGPSHIHVPATGMDTKFRTAEGKLINLVKGDLATQKTDVIVNTVGTSCDLAGAVVSRAILQVAGNSLQNDMDKSKPKSVKEGDIIVTGGANLDCKHVYHACILGTSWDGGANVETFIRGVIQQCLDKAHTTGMTSIAIPALGTGGLNYPRDIVAKILYEEAISLSSKNPSSSLNEIRIVVYDKDYATRKAFEEEMQQFIGTSESDVGRGPPVYTDFDKAKKEMKIGDICLQVCQGDITTETTDAIVNSTNPQLDMTKGGGVQSAIHRAGGNAIQTECQQLAKRHGDLKPGSVVMTTAGILRCQKIIHALVGESAFANAIYEVLKLAEKEKMSSISMPMLGTGEVGVNPKLASDTILETIGDFFVQCKPRSLRLVRVVIFKHSMVTVFQNSMETAVGGSRTDSKSVIKRSPDAVSSVFAAAVDTMAHAERVPTSKTPNRLILNIYAESKDNIDNVVTKIEKYAKEEFTEEVIEKDIISEITDKDLIDVIKMAQILHVEVVKDTSTKLRIRGPIPQVIKVLTETNKLVNDFTTRIVNEKRQKALAQTVRWQFQIGDDYEDYDEHITGIIEMAYEDKKRTIDFRMKGKKYRIDFNKLTATDVSDASTTVKVKRHQKESLTRVQAIRCPYYKLCREFVNTLKLQDTAFDPEKRFDKCFCGDCHKSRGDKLVTNRGQPPAKYSLPIGWARFALDVSKHRLQTLRVNEKWHVAFHGTDVKSIAPIIDNATLLLPGDVILGGKKLAVKDGHFTDDRRPAGFDIRQIFVTPTIKYAGHPAYAHRFPYKDAQGKKHIASVALQLWIRPGSYVIGKETVGAGTTVIDPNFKNSEMEWSTTERSGVVPYGLLVRVEDT
ncbi:protein mono-ADP-ribosyltransferase PARP14-like [Glandiceps talaboti]